MDAYDKFDLDHTDQDKVLFLMVTDTKFLAQCLRKGIKPRLFASEVRQKLASLVYDFFTKYGEAPSEELAELVATEMLKNTLIHESDSSMYEVYIDKLFGLDVSGGVVSFLLDRLDFFIKKRIVATTTNRLVALKERINVDPDKPLDIMRAAVEQSNKAVGRQVVESILDNVFIEDRKVLTRFGIADIDDSLGGGLKRGVFGILQAYTSVGKTWCITHLAKMAARFGSVPFVLPLEASNRMFRTRSRMSFTGMTTQEMYNNMPEVTRIIKMSLVRKTDVLILNDDEKSVYVDDLPALVEEVETKSSKPIDLILIDSADDMLPIRGGRYSNPLEATDAKYTWLKNYAKNEDKCVITTVQSKAEGETRFWLTAGTVGLGFVKARKATVGISLNATPKEIAAGLCRVYLFKHTDGRVGAKSWIAQDFSRGQFIIASGNYDGASYENVLRQYGVAPGGDK